MKLFAEFGKAQASVHVRKPVEVYAEGNRPQFGDERFGIEVTVLEHLERQVDDPDRQAVLVQVLRNRQEPDGVDLENGG